MCPCPKSHTGIMYPISDHTCSSIPWAGAAFIPKAEVLLTRLWAEEGLEGLQRSPKLSAAVNHLQVLTCISAGRIETKTHLKFPGQERGFQSNRLERDFKIRFFWKKVLYLCFPLYHSQTTTVRQSWKRIWPRRLAQSMLYSTSCLGQP